MELETLCLQYLRQVHTHKEQNLRKMILFAVEERRLPPRSASSGPSFMFGK